MACSRYFGVSPVSRHLFITKNVKKHEKLQSPLNKWLSQGILSFHLFLDILSYSKVSKNRKTTKSLEFLHLLQFLHNSTKTSAAGARQGTRSVPVISVPSRNEAWEVYPLEMYYPDDPTRLCRPKAGQSLVPIKSLTKTDENYVSIFNYGANYEKAKLEQLATDDAHDASFFKTFSCSHLSWAWSHNFKLNF